MPRPTCLDLFCGAGGASVGYARAGFDVVGVDNVAHPDYPFPITVADAMEVLADTAYLRTFDIVVGSPPCPRYSVATNAARRDSHPDFVPPTRAALVAAGVPFVIENVPGAPLIDPVILCGSMFGLRVRRHRLFESNIPLTAPCPCDHRAQGTPVGVYGNRDSAGPARRRPSGGTRGVKATSVADAQDAMGIDWMSSWDDLTDAIPPAYTEHLGRQLMEHLG